MGLPETQWLPLFTNNGARTYLVEAGVAGDTAGRGRECRGRAESLHSYRGPRGQHLQPPGSRWQGDLLRVCPLCASSMLPLTVVLRT